MGGQETFEGLPSARFDVGQIVRHAMFGYRGVIHEVDACFTLSDEWYEQVARSRPPKDAPWYHVLVDGTGQQTYVAERNLRPDSSPMPIDHPLLDEVLGDYDGRKYSDPSTVH